MGMFSSLPKLLVATVVILVLLFVIPVMATLAMNANVTYYMGELSKRGYEVFLNTGDALASVAADVNPTADATYDLGENSTPLRWRDLWLSRNASIEGTLSIADDKLFTMGDDDDFSHVLRSTILGSQTPLTGVLISDGDNYHMPALAANTLIVANTTSNGDILIAAKMSDGNSRPVMFFDGSKDQVRFGNVAGVREDSADTGGHDATFHFGSYEVSPIEGVHYYAVNKRRGAGATYLTQNYMQFLETESTYSGDIISHRSHTGIDSGNTQDLTGTIIGELATVTIAALGSPTYTKVEALQVFVQGSSFGTPTTTALSGIRVYAPTRISGTWGTYTGIEVDDPGTTASTNYAIWVKGGTTSLAGEIDLEGEVGFGVDARTIATTGDGSPATLTLDPTTAYVTIDCQDTDTCDITMSEAATVEDGDLVQVINISANVVDFADSAGVSELTGAYAMDQWDSLTMLYVSDRWVEISRSVN